MAPKPDFIGSQAALAPLTTIRLGGPAEYYCAPKNDDELRHALAWASTNGLPITVLGGGSNVILPDQGIRGLVIHPMDTTIRWDDEILVAGAGISLGRLITTATTKGRGGLRWVVGVPGQVGGTVAGNAGSRTDWIGSKVAWVEAMDRRGQLFRMPPNECAFGYRTSAFHTNERIIVRVGLTLPSVDPEDEQEAIRRIAQDKAEKQPLGEASAGCMFRNVPVAEAPASVQPMATSDGLIPVWKLVREVGLVGYRLGGMMISEKHANFMINTGTGTADQAVQLLSLVKQRVRDELGVQLVNEVRLLGF